MIVNGVEQKDWDSILQKCAFVVFEVVKQGIIQNLSNEELLKCVKYEVSNAYDKALSKEEDDEGDDDFSYDDFVSDDLDSEQMIEYYKTQVQVLTESLDSAEDKVEKQSLLSLRAEYYQNLGMFEEAIIDLEKTVELNKDFEFLCDDVFEKLGNCYKKAGDLENAVKSTKDKINAFVHGDNTQQEEE